MPCRAILLCTCISLVIHTLPAVATEIVFVDASATGAADGSSWADAFTDLNDALAQASDAGSGAQIWIAAGTYKPGSPEDGPEATFNLVSGAALYGGFAGGEQSLDERDWKINETILSGFTEGSASGASDFWTVLTAENLAETAILDGLTITGAGSDYPLEVTGGGLRSIDSQLHILNCTFVDNYTDFEGGGAAIIGGAAEFTNCTFIDNWTFYSGAALFAQDADIVIAGSVFDSNIASYEAAVYITGGTLTMTTSAVENNLTADYTAGLSLYDAVAEIEDSTFIGNKACKCSGGGGIGSFGSEVAIRSCLISGNSTDGLWGTGFTVIDSVVENSAYSGIYGGGSLMVVNSQIINNGGRGIESAFTAGPAEIHNSTITGNDDSYYGGGVLWAGADAELLITNSIITNNGGIDMGGVRFGGESFTMVNSLIAHNHAQYAGSFAGGVQLGAGANATITNSTIIENTSYGLAGGVAAAEDVSIAINNCILWNNWGDDGPGSPQIAGDISVAHSIVESDEPWQGSGNLNVDPMFADEEGRLASGSPAIDAGDNAAFLALDVEGYDLDGNPRIVDGNGNGRPVIDIGAFELQDAMPSVAGDLNGDGFVNTQDMLILLGAWGECDDCNSGDSGTSGGCPADLTGDCVVDVKDLLELLAAWG